MNWIVDHLTLADARRLDTFWRARTAVEGLAQAEIDAAAQFAAHRLVDFDEDRRRGRWILMGVYRAEDTHLAGYLSAAVIPRLDMLLGHIYIDDLYVLPACRRQGAGRALVTALLETARRRGATSVHVVVDPDHAGFETLFARAGFTIAVTGWASYRAGG